MTFQELREVAQAARDLEMWREAPFEDWWLLTEPHIQGDQREGKRNFLARLRGQMTTLVEAEKAYPASALDGPPRRRVRLVKGETDRDIFGRCAAYSDRTVCCNLHTIDAVMGCAFGCSYCTIQTFYPETAEIQGSLDEKLKSLELDPNRFYHIGTGQSSDSLVWGNREGVLDALLDFAFGNPNVLLELKTKSDRVESLLERELPSNLVCSWSLNTTEVIANEEHGTASLEQRMVAASRAAGAGIRVAFHFHPMVFHGGWSEEYPRIAHRLISDFETDQVAFLSMGSMTFIKPVVKEIRKRGGESKVLQMELVTDPHGKLTYPDEKKVALYSTLYAALQPWHHKIFTYLCMETDEIWRQVFGTAYATNLEFERDFAEKTGFGKFARTADPASAAVPSLH
jgi:spore photoproduct lyase